MASSYDMFRERDPLEREFVTSEGVDLRIRLGSGADRAAAYMIDFVIVFIAGLLLVVLAGLAGISGKSDDLSNALFILLLFLLRNGYFVGFELGTRAATLGKRAMKLRVIARDGGRLSGEAIITRNAMRELETGLPITFLMSATFSNLMGEPSTLASLAGFAWACIFLFFPLFNRDRLRVGDIVAGTWVVKLPRRRLGRSVVEQHHIPSFVFTEAQLSAYGEFELQKLEEVLRREEELAVIVVARTIRTRIGWTGDENNDLEFLKAYYAALCKRLERNMLFGKRRKDKYQKA